MGTLRLTLLRHAHAAPAEAAPDDFLRQLTERGRREAREVGERLARAGLVPARILASSAQRTRTTAQLAATALGLPAAGITQLDELFNADAQTLWEVLRREAGGVRHLLLCAHNPGISRLASELAAGTGTLPRRIDLPPAGLVTAVWEAPQPQWQPLVLTDAQGAEMLLP
jgi:phosphohistidine phosphatase